MWSDVRHAFRSLLKSPGFTLVAATTLALGIGANTAIFSLINAVQLHSMPYPHPEQLVVLWEKLGNGDDTSITWPNFQDWRSQNRTFAAIGGLRTERFRLTGGSAPEMVQGAQVSAGFFDVIGLPLPVGRPFTAAEDRPGAPALAVLSHKFWQQRFDGGKEAIGAALNVNGVVHTIVGVLPPEYDLLVGGPAVWTQLGRLGDTPAWQSRTDSYGIYAAGRMKPGTTLDQALADLKRITAVPQLAGPSQITIEKLPAGEALLDNFFDGDYRRGLWTLQAAAGVILLIACANLANLLLTRALGRRTELAVRSVLGASPARLTRELLSESVLLAGAGGALGLAFAWVVRNAIVALTPAGPSAAGLLERAQLDGSVFAATLALSALAVVLFGLWPAWKSSRPDLRPALQGAGRGAVDRGSTRVRETLVVVQVMLAVILLVAAGLLIRSLMRAQAVDLGFNPRGLLSAELTLPEEVYDSEEKMLVFNERVLEQVTGIAGVVSADLATGSPLNNSHWQTSYRASNGSRASQDDWPLAQMNVVSDGYFRTMGIDLLRGRTFGPEDVRGGRRAVIVDEAFCAPAVARTGSDRKRHRLG